MKTDPCAASFDNLDEEAKRRESYGGFLTLTFPVDPESGEVRGLLQCLCALGMEGYNDIQGMRSSMTYYCSGLIYVSCEY